jgi:Reverse transcriptase (RNA-dependent DNA polymerase)
MYLKNSPDIFQEKMSELMIDLEYVRTYLDDILAISSGTREDHLEKLEEVLNRLEQAGLEVNARKSFFGQTVLEYLSYWITRDGIQPLPQKVQAIHIYIRNLI